MILVDTNILIQYFREDDEIKTQLKSIGIEQVLISDVVLAELYQGARNKAELRRIKAMVADAARIPVNEEISNMAVELVEQFGLSHNCRISDAMIAATAVLTGFPLFTLNKKDFHFINGITMYNHEQTK